MHKDPSETEQVDTDLDCGAIVDEVSSVNKVSRVHAFYGGSVRMLAYLAILGACIAGYAGVAPWAIAVSAIALMSLSYAEHHGLYRRGQELGLTGVLEWSILQSAFNAVVAASIAFGFGVCIRSIASFG